MSLRTALTAALLMAATLAHAGSAHDKWVGQLQKYGVHVGNGRGAGRLVQMEADGDVAGVSARGGGPGPVAGWRLVAS